MLFHGILIQSYVVTPRHKNDRKEDFLLYPNWGEYKQYLAPYYSLKELWKMWNKEDPFQRKVLSIFNDAKKLDPTKYDAPGRVKDKTYTILRLRDGSREPLEFAWYDHPLVGVDKPMLHLLQKIAALIPEGWAKPYALSNL